MKNRQTLFSSFFSLLWFVSMFSAVWSGISHLPLMSRYGLVHSVSWSPSVAHYYSSAALLFLGTYAFTIWRLQGHSTYCLTRCGLVRILLLLGLAVTGLALRPVPAMRRSSFSSCAKPEPTPPMVKLGRTTSG